MQKSEKRARADAPPAAAAASEGAGGSVGASSSASQQPTIEWEDREALGCLISQLQSIKQLEAQVADVLLDVRPNLTSQIADSLPGISGKLRALEESVSWRYSSVRSLIGMLTAVKVAKPPLPQPIGNKALPAHARSTKPYTGRPCLDGLPPDVTHIVLGHLPMKDAVPLSRVNRSMRQQISDETNGIYKHLVIGKDERDFWRQGIRKNIEGDSAPAPPAPYIDHIYGYVTPTRPRRSSSQERAIEEGLNKVKQSLSGLRTVHITGFEDHKFPHECVEASRGTIRHMRLTEEGPTRGSSDLFDDDEFGGARRNDVEVVFSQMEGLYLDYWPTGRRFRKWRFPSLRSVEFSNAIDDDVKGVMRRARKLRTLVMAPFRFWVTEVVAALRWCPELVDIKWVRLGESVEDAVSLLTDLKLQLEPTWSLPSMKGVEKRLGIELSDKIAVPFEHDLMHRRSPDLVGLPAFLEWAAAAGCKIEWTARILTIDCSKDLVRSTPAPTGAMANLVRSLANSAKEVVLMCGGKALDQSWARLLVFSSATKLTVTGVSSPEALSSVPPFLTTVHDDSGGNRHLPKVRELEASSSGTLSRDSEDERIRDSRWEEVCETVNGPGSLQALLGALTGLAPLSLFSSVQMKCVVAVNGMDGRSRSPRVVSLALQLKSCTTTREIQSCMPLIAGVRPAKVILDVPAILRQCIKQAEGEGYAVLEKGEWWGLQLLDLRMPH
ncbi:unnamed protein product [Vitrella brassicaformis CCMP3155]|uniref:F-box domain-containing protein n=1 Tax=Vitrella brassicaformis (strain CCMP3155) TaxID=1169540 RepID=A0A0G4GEJ8_VITBC|nr:unnamed protein product [Vitrella brassicaformis CCMP3155]|mmetsp:Transcript_33145/g.95657  ORF Transcript_33145/g.95657 Transcript_33145/m.95657 type:complete len:722 (+) Transcript_33145:20-2185(+)|eukprot:CEM27800.1 unnamed protein product [Vitrella brassicaformis CCMP3155]